MEHTIAVEAIYDHFVLVSTPMTQLSKQLFMQVASVTSYYMPKSRFSIFFRSINTVLRERKNGLKEAPCVPWYGCNEAQAQVLIESRLMRHVKIVPLVQK